MRDEVKIERLVSPFVLDRDLRTSAFGEQKISLTRHQWPATQAFRSLLFASRNNAALGCVADVRTVGPMWLPTYVQ
jgi:hypothetical protein